MASGSSVYVVRYHDEGADVEFPLGESTSIGRDGQNDLVLSDGNVSRRHAQIFLRGDGAWLVDLGSRNGTRVDGQPVPANVPRQLAPGQTFNVGDTSLQLGLASSASLRLPPASRQPPVHTAHGTPDAENVLLYSTGQGVWRHYPLTAGQALIGRGADCDVVLDDAGVSRHHASLRLDANGIWLIDLGSTNGTQVGDQPLLPRQKRQLRPGEVFTIHGTGLVVVPAAQARAAMPDVGVVETSAPATRPGADEQTAVGTPVAAAAVALQQLSLGTLERATIGRSQDNQVVLDHPRVSRYHAVIERLGRRYRIRDLRSANGVFVNEQRIREDTWLSSSDRVQIGPYSFVLDQESFAIKGDEGIRIVATELRQQVSRRINLLQQVSLTVPPMEFVAVVGMSGSGKTTLVNALCGYRPATHGRVLVNGTDLYQRYDLFRNDIGYVPQRDIVHLELTVQEALDYAARLRMPTDTTPEERHARVLEVTSELGLSERKDVPVARLSGGQIKRVSIGVELLTRPRLYVLDEPTSGLDPGTEYEMMRLLRRLADQGRTILLVTHATKNVMLCDKVVFLARGGYLAYYGAPEEALAYFDHFRTPRERLEKVMEFDDIYNILDDAARGTPQQWAERFAQIRDAAAVATRPGEQPSAASARATARPRRRISALRQFLILSSRNVRILVRDRATLLLMLTVAPGIGLMDFSWGSRLYDAVEGNASRAISMWWVTGVVALLVGSLNSVREIVKEAEIYKRERANSLMVLPYLLAKVWLGVVFAAYSALALLTVRLLLVKPPLPWGTESLVGYFVTYFLGVLSGYLIGLAISAGAPNQQSAQLLLIAVLVPQFLFGGFMPLHDIPGGTAISQIISSRWLMEAFVRVSEMGTELANDPCWNLPEQQRKALSDEQKAVCPCMGSNMFALCADFPGMLSDERYSAAAKRALSQAEPVRPQEPTVYPSPTTLPAPTALPTPTAPPTLTPVPTPVSMLELASYQEQASKQGQEQRATAVAQLEDYRGQSIEQVRRYAADVQQQVRDYVESTSAQMGEARQEMDEYAQVRSQWEKDRQGAISAQEAMLALNYGMYSDYYRGSVFRRWVQLAAIMAAFFLLAFVFQRRKDLV